jgi:dipeptidyl aminopeptidase/acylaminoacyl peptidase
LKGISIAVALSLSPAVASLQAQNSVTVTDLVRRVQFPLVALSPDGRYAAYLSARGNLEHDGYDLTIRVVDTQQRSHPITVREYRLSPEETFNELEWLKPSAGEIRWLRSDVLLFVAKAGKRMQLGTWNAKAQQVHVVLDGHDRIELENVNDPEKSVTVVTTDSVHQPVKDAKVPADNSWLMRDGYRFFSPFKNPKAGRWVRTQRYTFSLAANPNLKSDGKASEQWESLPDESAFPSPSVKEDTESYPFDETPSPDGKWIAAVELRYSNLSRPDSMYGNFRIIAKSQSGRDTTILVPATRPYVMARTVILGWSADNQSVYYLYVKPEGTALNNVTLGGKVTTLWSGPELLAKPFPPMHKYQFMSRDGRFALLIRSTNHMPGELVKADLRTGAMAVLDWPNDKFARAVHPEVRLYNIEGIGGGDAWGRLYLPLNYRKGTRYPLVITQYASSPGFGESIGDEVPFVPMTANGIAVFDMYSGGLGQNGVGGKFRVDLNRVRRPLLGMQWIVGKLVDEGIVDPDRIGLTGLSYGSEITMYAYWNWNSLRALSSATASWDPSGYLFGGPTYSRNMNDRGFPAPDEAGLPTWRELVAGLNARADLPPLLWQSPDAEETFTAPTWTWLRRAGARVEWYEYPNEGHVKVHPVNKWWVFERNLEWFRFWLKDEEDPDPAKAEQYTRWRKMREQRAAMVRPDSTH